MTNQQDSDILQHQQTAIVLLDGDLRVRFLNDAAESLFEVGRGRWIGEPLNTLLDLGDVPDLRELLTANQEFTWRERQIGVAGSGMVTVDCSVTPIVMPAPSRLLLEFQALDRKLHINREDEQFTSQETSRMLVRGLAHEVKNPLGGIRGAAQLLEAELGSPALKEYTQVIIDEADRLRTLVDRLLGPREPLRLQPVNVHQVVEHVLRVLAAEARQPPVLVRDYDPSIPELPADEDQLKQALLNVLRNAYQALGALSGQGDPGADEPAPQLTLRTRILRRITIGEHQHRLVLCLEIEDNGPGIPADIRDRLFFPMISGRPDGSGLGLSITQHIVSEHGGLISVDSAPRRTCFTIYLPLERPNALPGVANAE